MSSNISGSKIFKHLNRVLNDPRPITADIFLNNYCNNKCPYCTYRRWEFDDGARYMKYEDFIRYATRLKELGVQGFILTGGGEPTISKDFDKIAEWLADNGFAWGINTNYNVLKLIRPNYLKVSLDGWDSNSYKNNRGVDAYQVVRNNIIKYDEWRKQNSPNTTLGIQIVAKSVSDVFNFYSGNKDLPVDYISFRPMESTLGKYYETLSDINVETRPVEIIRAIQNLASIDSRVLVNYKWEFLGRAEKDCTAQWAQIALNELGEVIYCCHKPFEIVGHVMDEDILQKKAKARTDMSLCDIPCRMTAPNYSVAQIRKEEKDIGFI